MVPKLRDSCFGAERRGHTSPGRRRCHFTGSTRRVNRFSGSLHDRWDSTSTEHAEQCSSESRAQFLHSRISLIIVDQNDLYLPYDNLTLHAETSIFPSNQSDQAMENGRKTTIVQRSRRRQKYSMNKLISSRHYYGSFYFSVALRKLQYGTSTYVRLIWYHK